MSNWPMTERRTAHALF